MEWSESRKEILPSLLKVQMELPRVIGYDSKGYGYDYTSLQKIIKVATPILSNNNLILTQSIGGNGETVTVTTMISHISGEYVTDTLILPPAISKGLNAVQGMGSAITYGRRYSLAPMLGIVTDEDTDGADTKPTKEDLAAKFAAMPDNVKKAFEALGTAEGEQKKLCFNLQFNWQEIYKKLQENN